MGLSFYRKEIGKVIYFFVAAKPYSCRVMASKEKVITGLFSDLHIHCFNMAVSEKGVHV